MSRRRAGHSRTWYDRDGKSISVIMNNAGYWVHSSEARKWPRCPRCRVPFEESPFGSGLCPICYFYKSISVEDFWRLHEEGYYLAPYNIGRRGMKTALPSAAVVAQSVEPPPCNRDDAGSSPADSFVPWEG